jgi:hypothetical protein
MAFFALSDIVGCITSGETSITYDQQFNNVAIETYYKHDYYNGVLLTYYGVVCVFGTKSQTFKFPNSADRDTFYNSLP